MPSIAGRLTFFSILLCGLWAAAQAAGTLSLDSEKSRIDFVGTKPGAMHRGGFKKFSVESDVDWATLSKSRFRIEIDTDSLWSDNNMLTSHLKNRDFFDVASHPKITFETSRIELSGADRAVLGGTLTMLGKAETVAVPCELALNDRSLQAKCGFKIDRTRWGMTYGKGRIDEDVEIETRFVFGR